MVLYMQSSIDVVGVGLNATDTLIVVPSVPSYGGKAPFTDEVISVGGQVASAMVTCQKLGLRSKYIGSIGDDERGKVQLESLKQSGVDIEHVQIRERCANQSAYIVIDQATGERTVFWHRDECLRILPEQIKTEQITCARLLHVDGHDTEAITHAAHIAKQAAIPVTADVDTIYPGLEKVLPKIDYLIASTEFPPNWTREQNPFIALKKIREEYKMHVTAMTLGRDGCLALDDDGFHYAPGFVVDCIDTTGAGDVFHGAFCYALLKDYNLDQALEFSNAMAAINCRALGARGCIATCENAEQLIDQGERHINRDFTDAAGCL